MSLKPPPPTPNTAPERTPTPPQTPAQDTLVPKVVFGIAKDGRDYLVVAITEKGTKVLHRDDHRMSAEEQLAALMRRYWYDPEGVLRVTI